jgi:hypothetical protein
VRVGVGGRADRCLGAAEDLRIRAISCPCVGQMGEHATWYKNGLPAVVPYVCRATRLSSRTTRTTSYVSPVSSGLTKKTGSANALDNSVGVRYQISACIRLVLTCRGTSWHCCRFPLSNRLQMYYNTHDLMD